MSIPSLSEREILILSVLANNEEQIKQYTYHSDEAGMMTRLLSLRLVAGRKPYKDGWVVSLTHRGQWMFEVTRWENQVN